MAPSPSCRKTSPRWTLGSRSPSGITAADPGADPDLDPSGADLDPAGEDLGVDLDDAGAAETAEALDGDDALRDRRPERTCPGPTGGSWLGSPTRTSWQSGGRARISAAAICEGGREWCPSVG